MRYFLSTATVVMFALGIALLPEARAQGPIQPAHESAGHLERPDQPPHRFIGPRQVSPPPSCESLTVNGFTSVQINVDDDGNNILRDAANEPSIAIDPTNPDNIVIGWRQFDTIESNFRQAGYAHSQDAGGTWTFPGVLEPGVFRSDPVLATDADGQFYYYSVTRDKRGLSAQMFISADAGESWTGPILAFGGDKPWMAVDTTDGIGSGNIYVEWEEKFIRSIDGGRSFISPIEFPARSKWGTMSVGFDGYVFVVDYFSRRVSRSTDAQDPDVTPSFDAIAEVDFGDSDSPEGGSPNPGGLLRQPWIATDHSDRPTRGNVYVAQSFYVAGPDPMDFLIARSTDGGFTWSDPVRINDDDHDPNAWQWFGTMDVAPSGRIDAVWYDTRNTGESVLSEVFYAFSIDAGDTWTANVQVAPMFNSTIGWPQQNKIGDYIGVISDSVAANVAYAATYNGEQDVYFLRIEIDCNENGTHDGDDIIAGRSEDCNDNAVPDECEPDEDCNDDGMRDLCEPDENDCNENDVPDECDIRDGTSEDCNENGIPDECLDLENDCNENRVPDECDIADGRSEDCNENRIPDECIDLENDCNENQVPDECDIADGTSRDCNRDRVPDECEPDHELLKLLADDATERDRFGNSVAISGATVIVGAYLDDDNGTDSGSAYLFDISTGEQIAKILPNDGTAGDRFGTSVAISGATAILGAPFDDDNGFDSGSAYLFDTSTGRQIAKLLPRDGVGGDWFGTSVGIGGGTAIVGALLDDDNGLSSGSAYLFDISTGEQIAKLLPSDGEAGDRFGTSVGISGGTAIVGAVTDDDNGTDSGSAYLFDTATGQQIAKFLPTDGHGGDRFGASVAISGTLAIVGAAFDDDNGSDSGSAYLFDASTGEQIAKLLPDDGVRLDSFGGAVAISGGTAIVGASFDEDNGSRSGAAYLFDASTGQEITKLLPTDGAAGDEFGVSVAISGAVALVGAYLNDDEGTDSGSAYLFELPDCEPCVRDPEWLCDGDVDGDGQVNPVDSGLVQAAFGSSDEQNLCQYDIDCDGQINPVDAGIVQSLFGTCEGPREVCP